MFKCGLELNMTALKVYCFGRLKIIFVGKSLSFIWRKYVHMHVLADWWWWKAYWKFILWDTAPIVRMLQSGHCKMAALTIHLFDKLIILFLRISLCIQVRDSVYRRCLSNIRLVKSLHKYSCARHSLEWRTVVPRMVEMPLPTRLGQSYKINDREQLSTLITQRSKWMNIPTTYSWLGMDKSTRHRKSWRLPGQCRLNLLGFWSW